MIESFYLVIPNARSYQKVVYTHGYSAYETIVYILVRLHLEFVNVEWQPYYKKDSDLLE
jgi:hypothetical protein